MRHSQGVCALFLRFGDGVRLCCVMVLISVDDGPFDEAKARLHVQLHAVAVRK